MSGRTHGKTTTEVLNEVKSVHGDNLVYDRFVYKNCDTKVIVGCPTHSYYFEKWPNDLKAGSGCPKCAGNYRKSNKDFIREMRIKFPHIAVIGAYKNAKTKLQFYCKHHHKYFITSPNGILSNHYDCEQCAWDKFFKTKIERGQITPVEEKDSFAAYRYAVWKEANKTFKNQMVGERTLSRHLDHIVSIKDGFTNNIDPRIMGSIYNLRLIAAKKNRKKSYKSDITIDALLEKYYA